MTVRKVGKKYEKAKRRLTGRSFVVLFILSLLVLFSRCFRRCRGRALTDGGWCGRYDSSFFFGSCVKGAVRGQLQYVVINGRLSNRDRGSLSFRGLFLLLFLQFLLFLLLQLLFSLLGLLLFCLLPSIEFGMLANDVQDQAFDLFGASTGVEVSLSAKKWEQIVQQRLNALEIHSNTINASTVEDWDGEVHLALLCDV